MDVTAQRRGVFSFYAFSQIKVKYTQFLKNPPFTPVCGLQSGLLICRSTNWIEHMLHGASPEKY